MERFASVFSALVREMETHPAGTARDWLKFLYQGEFGAGHMLPDRETALHRIEAELSALETEKNAIEAAMPAEEAFTPFGDGLLRLHLRPVRERLSPETAAGLFLAAGEKQGDMARFEEKLAVLLKMAKDGKIPVNAKEISAEIEAWKAAGRPAVSHSDRYREAYRPAYRLVPEEAARFLPLFEKTDALLKEKERVTLAIDGCCAAGKSTLGVLLKTVYGAALFHMDDYFLPFAMRTPERLNEPGGNVDRERFWEEIGQNLREDCITYRPFSCQTGELLPPVKIENKRLSVVEGAYSMHPELRGAYDLSVFLSVNGEEQSRRLLERNGPEMHRRFLAEWIPMEEKYFAAFSVEEACTFRFL